MNAWNRGFTLFLLATCHSSAASVSMPVVTLPVLRSDFVLDPATTSGNPGSQWSRTETTGPDGATITELHGSDVSSGSRTTSLPGGSGGTLQWSRNQSFDGTFVQSISTTADSWRYESTFAFQHSFQYTATSSTSGRFFFIITASSENTLGFDRYARIVVDQPLIIRLSLSGAFSQGDFTSATGSAVLLASPFNLQTRMFSNPHGNLTGDAEPTLLQSAGTKGSVDYAVNASGTRDGVDYEIRLSPNSPGTAEEIELRWFLDYQSTLEAIGSNRLTTDQEVSGILRESFTVTAIPEPSPALLVSLATIFTLGSRRRRPPAGSRAFRKA